VPAWTAGFITEMHRRAAESDIIIVNHNLFFADLSLRQTGGPDAECCRISPPRFLTKRNELEDVAGSYFGVSVSNLRFEELARDVGRHVVQARRSHLAGSDSSTGQAAGALTVFLWTVATRGWPVGIYQPRRLPGKK